MNGSLVLTFLFSTVERLFHNILVDLNAVTSITEAPLGARVLSFI